MGLVGRWDPMGVDQGQLGGGVGTPNCIPSYGSEGGEGGPGEGRREGRGKLR